MYTGRIVETGPAGACSHAPLHPYTLGLLAAIDLDNPTGMLRPSPVRSPTRPTTAGLPVPPALPVRTAECAAGPVPLRDRACRGPACFHPDRLAL